MRKISAIIITLLLFMTTLSYLSLAENSKVFAIQFSIDKQANVQLLDLRLYDGSSSENAESEYLLVVLSDTGTLLHKVAFEVTFTAYADADPLGRVLPGTEEQIGSLAIERDSVELLVRVPYFDNAAKFEIRKGSQVIFESPIDLCNSDGMCQSERGENFLSCEADCKSGSDDGLCDEIFDARCDPNCKEQAREDKDTDCTCGNGVCDGREDSYYCPKDCGNPSNPVMMWLIGISVVIVLLVAGIVFLILKAVGKKKKKK